ncbi:ABC transporter ATP-binding protein [Vibrio rumoiensis]|uniref:ABC transporter domain-containing protein n=1 Tax=Vibrio rumoiensis 1S-45 TaxID=1188252 RepID=A0A1E5E763_9VIBR|nr:ABC transporter ATP-binding protein [Vibrio rumoiensis]OEF30149.1 hypothetical protein A1QC_00285 [Vibrio rumoiensis 1S-45]
MDIIVENITYQFQDDQKLVLRDLSIEFKSQTWTCLLGQSGCGKTTLLKLLAGLHRPDELIGGSVRVINHVDRLDQTSNIAYMGQKDLLFPWLNVLQNTCLERYLQTGKISSIEANKAHVLLKSLGLAGKESLLPQQLSGGMRQRVALARTLMQDKPIILMDEPFSALDALTRYELQTLACERLKEKTVVFITHDIQEALRVADRVLVMNAFTHTVQEFELNITSATPRDIDVELALSQRSLLEQLVSARRNAI